MPVTRDTKNAVQCQSNVRNYHLIMDDQFYVSPEGRSQVTSRHPNRRCWPCFRDIRDRSVLRIFETGGMPHQLPPPGPVNGTSYEDNSYFSVPEFDGDYQSQHVHKAKVGPKMAAVISSIGNNDIDC